VLQNLQQETPSLGKQIHDANLVAVAIRHGIARLLTLNARDFRRYSEFVDIITPA